MSDHGVQCWRVAAAIAVALVIVALLGCGADVERLRRRAENGNAAAQRRLGYMYSLGEGVPQDHAEAVRLYRLAATQGDAKAQHNLGVKYSRGEGVSQDYSVGAQWYKRAAEQGNVDAQVSLANLYYRGQGLAQDYVEAARWFLLAAEQGNADAQYNLGAMYARGEGVSQSGSSGTRVEGWSPDAPIREEIEAAETPSRGRSGRFTHRAGSAARASARKSARILLSGLDGYFDAAGGLLATVLHPLGPRNATAPRRLLGTPLSAPWALIRCRSWTRPKCLSVNW